MIHGIVLSKTGRGDFSKNLPPKKKLIKNKIPRPPVVGAGDFATHYAISGSVNPVRELAWGITPHSH